MNKLNAIYFAYSGVVGVIIGLVIALFMGVLELANNLLWQVVPHLIGDPIFYPLIVCSLGGLVIGLFTRKVGKIPQSLTELTESPETGVKHPMRNNVIGGFLILLFGASVGPEAALAVIICGVVAGLAKRYPFIKTHAADLTEFSIGAMLGVIFAAPLFGVSRSFEKEEWRVITTSKVKKYVLYIITMFGGFIGYTLTYNFFPNQEQVFAIRRLAPHYTWQGLLLVIPTLLLGILFGLLFSKAQEKVEEFNQRIKNPVPLAVTGGIILGLAGMASPYLLFSGEHGVLSFSREAATTELWLLVVIGLGKFVLTMMCLAFNWRGGIIFPMIFSTVALGLALSQVFHYSPGLILVVFVASACTIILKQPLATAFLFLLLFPLNVFIWLLIASFATHYAMQWFTTRRQNVSLQSRKTKRNAS